MMFSCFNAVLMGGVGVVQLLLEEKKDYEEKLMITVTNILICINCTRWLPRNSKATTGIMKISMFFKATVFLAFQIIFGVCSLKTFKKGRRNRRFTKTNDALY